MEQDKIVKNAFMISGIKEGNSLVLLENLLTLGEKRGKVSRHSYASAVLNVPILWSLGKTEILGSRDILKLIDGISDKNNIREDLTDVVCAAESHAEKYSLHIVSPIDTLYALADSSYHSYSASEILKHAGFDAKKIGFYNALLNACRCF